MDEETVSFLKYTLLDSESPLQYGSPSVIFKALKRRFPNTKLNLRDIEAFVESHVRPRAILARPPPSNFKRVPYRTWGYGDLFQVDLMFMKWAQKNILTVIDVFSKQAEAEICYDKSARNVTAAMRRAVDRMGLIPNKVQSDQGKEFFNDIFGALMEEYGAHHYYVDSETKAPVVERFNRTLREKYQIIKLMEPRLKPPQILRRAVAQYNNTPHTALRGATPASIDYKNAGLIMEADLTRRERQALINSKNVKPYKFNVGDFVRATRERKFASGIRSKEADGIFTEEVFKITRRFRKFQNDHLNLYEVQDLTGENLQGVLYEGQIRKAHGYEPDRKQVKKVISKRKHESVVSLVDYPSNHREIIPNPKKFRRRAK